MAARRRSILLLATLTAVALAAWLGEPRPSIAADPDLAFLLRGMAVIKAAIASAVLALVWWRAGQPAPMARFLAYTLATALLAAMAVLVWQLAVVLMTSVVFHATLLSLGILALGDVRRDRAARRST